MKYKKEWLSTQEACKELGISRVTLDKYVREGRIKMVKWGNSQNSKCEYSLKSIEEYRRSWTAV